MGPQLSCRALGRVKFFPAHAATGGGGCKDGRLDVATAQKTTPSQPIEWLRRRKLYWRATLAAR
jgi:hypothetical protein